MTVDDPVSGPGSVNLMNEDLSRNEASAIRLSQTSKISVKNVGGEKNTVEKVANKCKFTNVLNSNANKSVDDS